MSKKKIGKGRHRLFKPFSKNLVFASGQLTTSSWTGSMDHPEFYSLGFVDYKGNELDLELISHGRKGVKKDVIKDIAKMRRSGVEMIRHEDARRKIREFVDPGYFDQDPRGGRGRDFKHAYLVTADLHDFSAMINLFDDAMPFTPFEIPLHSALFFRGESSWRSDFSHAWSRDSFPSEEDKKLYIKKPNIWVAREMRRTYRRLVGDYARSGQ